MQKTLAILFSLVACIAVGSPTKSMLGSSGMEFLDGSGHFQSEVEYIEFDGSQCILLDDIAPNYYTYKYTEIDYQLTEIKAGVVQKIGSSSLNVYICTGHGYVQTQSLGIHADLDRHVITMDGVSYPYQCFYDGMKIFDFSRTSNSERRFCIGASDERNGLSYFSMMRFFGMTISASSASNSPEHFFVPYRIDEIGCIKDIVTGRIYLPTNPVIIGPDKE